jgi:trehalose 6-phosphate synthase
MVLVTERTREQLEDLVNAVPSLHIVAEHGYWARTRGHWQTLAKDPGSKGQLANLHGSLSNLCAQFPGASVELGSVSLTIHWRKVSSVDQEELYARAAEKIDVWLSGVSSYERVDGPSYFCVKPTYVRKSLAVPWAKQQIPHGAASARVLALGDEYPDEDTFSVLGVHDDAVLVGHRGEQGRGSSHAHWSVNDYDEVLSFLFWLRAFRRGGQLSGRMVIPVLLPRVQWRSIDAAQKGRFDVLCISNRLANLQPKSATPSQRRVNVGGLASALLQVASKRKMLWLGWSGRVVTAGEQPSEVAVSYATSPALAWIDFPEQWKEDFYSGFCNRTLWPLVHLFTTRVELRQSWWEAYKAANASFARAALDLVDPETPIWVHDYHLLLLAHELRNRAHSGSIGFFLHTPWPCVDVFETLPWASEILEAMFSFDLIGFHTHDFATNFLQCASALTPATVTGDLIQYRARSAKVYVFPLGIETEIFAPPKEGQKSDIPREIAAFLRETKGCRLIIGVDRLDYTKGIVNRLLAFEKMLHLEPTLRRKVVFLQIAVPSREDVVEYAEQRTQIESVVGKVNGELGDADWTPLRYLYRGYDQSMLAEWYRCADLCAVTPLRDGMNLVAKEFLAAQRPSDPGVLMLSRFAGAAEELQDAVLTNPWWIEGMARDMLTALRMPKELRVETHARLLVALKKHSALSWADEFLAALQPELAEQGELQVANTPVAEPA